MITKITTVDELKQIFIEILLNKTDKISDISNDSVLNGIAYGCAKLAQRLMVNEAVIEGHLFPDTAYGQYLDEIAKLNGISDRFTEFGSSTYVRVEGEEGTTYSKATTTFTSTSGITFIPDEDFTIDENGYGYISVHSLQTGSTTNVDALTINTVSPVPNGHTSCTNEYRATGGMDNEDDDTFRQRIKESVNQLARNTISYLEQIFMKINKKVLKINKGGIDSDGNFNLTVVPINGQNFTDEEFNEILSKSEQFLPLDELLKNDSGFSLKLNNVDWHPIDIDFRVDIDSSYDKDVVRNNMQVSISKLFDYRSWEQGEKIEWNNILYAAKNIDGVRYIPDAYFSPSADINIDKYQLPRVRGFIIRDLDGNIIFDNKNVLSSFNYPNDSDNNFSSSVIQDI